MLDYKCSMNSLSQCIILQELDKSTMECMRFKERNMALARELATFRLYEKLVLHSQHSCFITIKPFVAH